MALNDWESRLSALRAESRNHNAFCPKKIFILFNRILNEGVLSHQVGWGLVSQQALYTQDIFISALRVKVETFTMFMEVRHKLTERKITVFIVFTLKYRYTAFVIKYCRYFKKEISFFLISQIIGHIKMHLKNELFIKSNGRYIKLLKFFIWHNF